MQLEVEQTVVSDDYWMSKFNIVVFMHFDQLYRSFVIPLIFFPESRIYVNMSKTKVLKITLQI